MLYANTQPKIMQSLGGGQPGQYVITTATNASSTVGSTSQTVVATNTARTLLRIGNNGPTAVYLNFRTTALPYTGIMLAASSTYLMDGNETVIYTGPVSAITGVGTNTLSVMEK